MSDRDDFDSPFDDVLRPDVASSEAETIEPSTEGPGDLAIDGKPQIPDTLPRADDEDPGGRRVRG